MTPSRRDVLRAVASLALAPTSCLRKERPAREDGRWVVPFWYAQGDRARRTLLDLVARFNTSQSRVVVRPVYQGDYFESLAKLRAAIAAGSAPALSHVVLEVLPYLARAGVLEALDDYEGARAIPLVEALTQPGSFSGSTPQTFAVPFNRSTPVAFYNARVFDEERVEPPTTWDDLVQTAVRLTRRSGGQVDRWGFEVPIAAWYWVALMGQAGGRLIETDGEISLGGRAGEEALEFWQRLVHVERAMRPPPGADYQAWQSTTESFLRERVAMMWSSTAFVRYLEETATFPVRAAPLPRKLRASVPTGGTMFVLLRQAPLEEKQAAWEFVRWMCEPAQASEWSKRTGYIPIAKTAVSRMEGEGFYRAHENDRVAYDELVCAAPWPWASDLFRIERDVLEPLLQDAVLTCRDPGDTLREARAQARQRV